MNRDLEEQLGELGDGCRAVVDRLTRSAEVEPRADGAKRPTTYCNMSYVLRRHRGWLVAASLLVLAGLAVVFCPTTDSGERRAAEGRRKDRPDVYTVRVTDAATEYTLAHIRSDEAVKEMIRTQNADGGWKNDFLTRQNAEALKLCGSEEAKIAYKKAMRNLRARGAL